MCPYGRLQSALTDDDTINVGYDYKRGEPRGAKGRVKGDCIDCHRCVQVCPTGIDIEVHADPGDVVLEKTARFLGPNPQSVYEEEDDHGDKDKD